jgi:hypothetical protein
MVLSRCGLLSVPFLGQRLKLHNWVGIAVLSSGLVIKGLPDAAKGLGMSHEDMPIVIPADAVSGLSLFHIVV